MIKRTTGISRILARMTILPLMVFGIVTTIFSLYCVTASMEAEVYNELQSLAGTTIETLDLLYPGDYSSYSNEDELLITKGSTILNSNYQLIDSLKAKTNVEYTLFYGDLRIITTLQNTDGSRLIGTKANPAIINAVLKKENSKFYKKAEVHKTNYYAYYEPLFNKDGACIGMLATLLPSKRVHLLIIKSALPILILSFFAIIIAFFWAGNYSKNFINVIQKMEQTFDKAANGSLSNTVSPELLSRKDEFGSMAHSLVNMQSALRILIEQDALTQLNNRRFGQQKLDQMLAKTNGTSDHFCIALGDIDFFKKFNDTYGHDCGDLVLQTIAKTLQLHVKDHGYCVRWGGEEFLIVFTSGDFSFLKTLMENLIYDIQKLQIPYKQQMLSVTMTFGLIDTKDMTSSDEIVKAVDNLLYYGKEHGRNRLVTEDNH